MNKNSITSNTILIFSLFIIVLISSRIQAQITGTGLRNNQCLNGWWDFHPVYFNTSKTHSLPGKVPVEGWFQNGILVPGSWKNSNSELKATSDIWNNWKTATSFNFSAAWDTTNTAWYRHSVDIQEINAENEYFLRFDGVLRESWIFINGHEAGHRKEGSLPSEHNITQWVKQGKNEILVYVTDYKRDENGRTFVNIGTDQMGAQMGIWNDVFLEIKPKIRICDVTIQTSTRKNELKVLYTLLNNSSKPIILKPSFDVTSNGTSNLSFDGEACLLKPGEQKNITKVVSWKGYIPWSSKNPWLYHLNMSLFSKNSAIDQLSQRFGFREVWIEGHNILLNGEIVHLVGEWGHKDHFDFFRPEYVRQWYGMLKDLNMNYMRTHTFPHPKFMIDMADEMGILVCLESAWFMSGSQAMDKEEFWQNARDHARDNVITYKNSPSVILWSSGNEVRWGWNLNAVIKNGPTVDSVYTRLDPTRVVYSDGSTSLWDERKQPLFSRHYGLECTGEEFWDKSKPLHVGEFGKWHYGQPIDNLVWGNDQIFASFEKCATAIADEAADIILQARSNEVACLFPWNISCLDNYRPSGEEKLHQWADVTGPFAKPLRTGPYATEFAWWNRESKGYIPGAGFEIIKNANRPLAIYIRERLNQTFDDTPIEHTVNLINDIGEDKAGVLEVSLVANGKIIDKMIVTMKSLKGRSIREKLTIKTPKVDVPTEVSIQTVFRHGNTILDKVSRTVWVSPAAFKTEPWRLANCFVFGDGSLRNLLQQHSVNHKYVTSLDSLPAAANAILIVEKNAAVAGSVQNIALKIFIQQGGKVLILEQENSLMPQVSIESKPSERAFIRAYNHPLMNRFTQADFEYWGTDPYGKSNSSSWIVVKPYKKPPVGNTTILLDCGFGDFGSGGLSWTPLFETQFGKGIAIASQLRLTDKANHHPSAHKFIAEALNYLSVYKPLADAGITSSDTAWNSNFKALQIQPKASAKVTVLSGNKMVQDNAIKQLKQQIENGASVVIHNVDSLAIVALSKEMGIHLTPVNLGPVYNLVRDADHPLLNGISNQETYWLDAAHYTPMENKNRLMDNWLFRSTQGISLLANETQSCWREFYTKGAMSEWLRMPVITHMLYNNSREKASGMMLFNIGKGQLIITQVPVQAGKYAKSDIYWLQLLGNLGVQVSASVFDGERVAFGAQRSNGYPENVRVITNPDDALLASVIAKGNPGETSERFQNQGLSEGFKWEKLSSPGGIITLPDGAKKAIVYFDLTPGRPRKLQEVIGGWPDPSQQTLLNLQGNATVTLYVNGAKYQSIKLNGDTSNISDIDLNQFWNSILLVIEANESKVKLWWRNRQNRDEVEFGFN